MPKILDIDDYRVSQSPVIKTRTVSARPVHRRPGRHEFIRVCPDAPYNIEVNALQFQGTLYLAGLSVFERLGGDLRAYRLSLAQNRQGETFVLSTRLGDDSWATSAMSFIEAAKTHWCKRTTNMSLGRYETIRAVATGLPEPMWPQEDFNLILGEAFADACIEDDDHPVVRRIFGEI